MNNSDLQIMPGSRVLVFDSSLFIDDVTTPLSYTLRPATVIRRYGRLRKDYGNDLILGPYPDLVDVVFDHREGVSKGHFTNSVQFKSRGQK